jgi:hypothetical protein
MSTYTYEAVAGEDVLAARVVNAPIPLLLVASKHWRELRKHLEEDAPKVLAEDLLTKGTDHDATRGFVRSTVQLSPQS